MLNMSYELQNGRKSGNLPITLPFSIMHLINQVQMGIQDWNRMQETIAKNK